MCEFKGKTYSSDVGRIINKYDIYYCNFGEFDEDDNSSIISKSRPAVIVSAVNNPKSNTYHVAPIRTEHKYEVSKDTLDFIISERRKQGRIYVPIEMEPDKFYFIDITQLTIMPSGSVSSYKSSILNQTLKDKIDAGIMELLFGEKIPVSKTKVKEVVKKTPEESPLKQAKVKGTKKATGKDHYPDGFLELMQRYESNPKEMTQSEMADKLGIHHKTVCYYIKKYRDNRANLATSTIELKQEVVQEEDSEFDHEFISTYKNMKKGMITKYMMATRLGLTMDELRKRISKYESSSSKLF